MSLTPFNLLILEDNPLESALVTRFLKKDFPQAKIFRAQTVSEAQLFLSEFKIDFFLLDIHLPDGNGIDFLCDIIMTHPEARSILITATPLPEYQEQANALGALRLFEKPLNRKALVDLIEKEMAPQAAAVSDPSEFSFRGALSHLTPLDIIQLKCLSQATLGLRFKNLDGAVGRIFLRDGEIVHAETPLYEGLQAIAQILSWKKGEVSELYDHSPPKHSIIQNWQNILMEASQMSDEGKVKA